MAKVYTFTYFAVIPSNLIAAQSLRPGITFNDLNLSEKKKNLMVFFLYWVVVFVLYLPAAEAGRVGDFPGWVNFLTSNNFVDYLNRKGSGIPSMYQFTQTVTYLFYQLFHANAWLWHLLYITLQALNGLLLYLLFGRIFQTIAFKEAALISFSGALLFCVCPHISEVVVWEPSFHYLLGLLFILSIAICLQWWLQTQNVKFAWFGAVLFLLSSYSLEVFYLTPIFTILLAAFYATTGHITTSVLKKTLLVFTIPQGVFFIIHFLLLRTLYHEGVAHIGSAAIQFNDATFSKPLKYLFHIVLFGRYFSNDFRIRVYHICESKSALVLFYSIFLSTITYLLFRFRALKGTGKSLALLFLFCFFSLGLVTPLAFPDMGIVILDRYTYVPAAFITMFLAVLFASTGKKPLLIALTALYALINIRYTHKANAYWQQSAHIVNNLVHSFPNDPAKKVLLLNLPECLDGVQMVGTRDDGEFRMMYDAIMPHKLPNLVYDVEAFYMRSPNDGAHVLVVNDSTLHITLNQWGTWWLYYGLGATSYENSDFKVDMKDAGHLYELTVKHPATDYLALYMVGDQWKKVDWNKKAVEQY